ncbi:hypothetical protein [Candidatus Phycosocius bacilliformis]|nr:hypothetical protein [Candidatus Phycosocius bacilliformis]
MRAARNSDNPIDRGVVASGMSRDGLDTGLRVMLPTLQNAAFDAFVSGLVAEGAGTILGKAAGPIRRAVGKGRMPSGASLVQIKFHRSD